MTIYLISKSTNERKFFEDKRLLIAMMKHGGPTLYRGKSRGSTREFKRSMHILMAVLTIAAVCRQIVMVHVAEIAPETCDARRAPAHAAYGIAESVDGTHVAVAFPTTCGHIPVALDAGGTVTTGEQRPARTLTGRLFTLNRFATDGGAVAC